MSYSSREESVFQGAPFELYKFAMGSQQWFITSGDETRIYSGNTYSPAPVERTRLGKGAEQKDNATDVRIPRDHAIAQLFLTYLPASPLTLIIYRGHDGEEESATIVIFVGSVVSASFDEDCVLHAAPEEALLKYRIPRGRYQRPCNKIIYSAHCGVDRANFAQLATVNAIAGAVVSAAEFAAHPDGWWTNGYIEFGSERRMVIHHAGADVTLILPMPSLAINDQLVAYPGCPRTYQAGCIDKFSNGPNFLGFEWIPERNPFKGIEWS